MCWHTPCCSRPLENSPWNSGPPSLTRSSGGPKYRSQHATKHAHAPAAPPRTEQQLDSWYHGRYS
eukprot:3095432-Pyramimonas_sp.AAC.1